eukprot:4644429-Amphidinium_carterae.1
MVKVSVDCKPPWVFTDAAVKDEENSDTKRITIGGLLYEPTSLKPASYFSEVLPSSFGQSWALDAPSQPICQAETFAVIAAKMLWSKRLADRRAIFA